MSNYINLRNIDFSFLGKGSKMKGIFHLTGITHISSELEGELTMETKAHLYLERNGKFKGSIKCHDIEIYGELEGTLESTGKVTVYPSASIKGKISSNDIIIYPGACLNIDGYTTANS